MNDARLLRVVVVVVVVSVVVHEVVEMGRRVARVIRVALMMVVASMRRHVGEHGLASASEMAEADPDVGGEPPLVGNRGSGAGRDGRTLPVVAAADWSYQGEDGGRPLSVRMRATAGGRV